MNYKNPKAVRDKVIVKLDTFEELQPSGLYVPESVIETTCDGEVISIGGMVKNPDLKPGVRVRCGKWKGTVFLINDNKDEKYACVKESEIDWIYD